MGRPFRIQFPGAVYHIFSRGNWDENIFLDDGDRYQFIKILSSTVTRLNWLCHAYCLMSNHYHLLIETPDGLLSRGMQYLNSNYARKFNRKYDLKGHLFQKRFSDKLIDGEIHFLTTARYIVRNPIEANLVQDASQWKWSSFRATVGLEAVPDYLCVEDILSCLSRDHSTAMEYFSDMVHRKNGDDPDLLPKQISGRPINPDQEKRLRPILDVRQSRSSITRTQRILSRPTLEELFRNLRNDDVETRNRIINAAFRFYGYSQSEIAGFLKLHRTTISRIANKNNQ